MGKFKNHPSLDVVSLYLRTEGQYLYLTTKPDKAAKVSCVDSAHAGTSLHGCRGGEAATEGQI